MVELGADFFLLEFLGLYFKLHGTHRPNSMKKTVIKRRKRVPAAPGVGTGSGMSGGRMSDQAAAEALVAVGRVGVSPPGGANDDSDGEGDQPKRKRTRRSAKASRAEKDDDVNMDGEDEDEPSASAPQLRERKRRGVPANGWMDGRSASPHRGGVAPSRSDSYLARGGIVLPSPHGHVGFDLPPLAQLNGAFLGNASAPPSSYIRSGSNAPSRTHSPLGPAGSGVGASGPGAPNAPGAPGAGYAHPHGHPHVLPPQYYAGPPPSEMSSLMVAAGVALGGLGIPSYMDLERHYHELGEQKRRWEEMMERTDRLMAGMKRTLDEMKGLVAQGVVGGSPVHHVQHQPMQGQQQQQQGQQQPGSQQQSPQIPSAASPTLPAGAPSATTSTTTPAAAQSVPLNRTDKDKSSPSIWPVVADASGAAGKP